VGPAAAVGSAGVQVQQAERAQGAVPYELLYARQPVLPTAVRAKFEQEVDFDEQQLGRAACYGERSGSRSAFRWLWPTSRQRSTEID
jgi:hypothetical protein